MIPASSTIYPLVGAGVCKISISDAFAESTIEIGDKLIADANANAETPRPICSTKCCFFFIIFSSSSEECVVVACTLEQLLSRRPLKVLKVPVVLVAVVVVVVVDIIIILLSLSLSHALIVSPTLSKKRKEGAGMTTREKKAQRRRRDKIFPRRENVSFLGFQIFFFFSDIFEISFSVFSIQL